MDNDILLEIENISKSFPGVKALDDVSLSIKKGEIRGLVGENGAGKSTLIKIIMGVYEPDNGRVLLEFNGIKVTPANPLEAAGYGLYANYQHVAIAPELSVGENYFLGKFPKGKSGFIKWKEVYSESKKILEEFGLEKINPKTRIKDLPLAQQAMITISKIVAEDYRLVIFDEPTALLTNEEVDILFNFIKQLKRDNVGIIYISHRLEEVLQICDSATVLKDGSLVETLNIDDVTEDKLISLMVGRELKDIYNKSKHNPRNEVVEVKNLTLKPLFQNISFNVKKGEVVGFFGLIGAGRSEIMETLYGARKPDSGSVKINGESVFVKNPNHAMKLGMGYVFEDRREQALALPLSVKVNINMASYEMVSSLGFINVKKEAERAESFIAQLNIKTPGCNQIVNNLSGGNQQKVVISKLLSRDPDIFIFDEPTVGVDVGAKGEIYAFIDELVNRGKAIILITSYLPELLGLSDRIYVVAGGSITAEYNIDELSREEGEEEILKAASSLELFTE